MVHSLRLFPLNSFVIVIYDLKHFILIDFSLTVKTATLIFIPGRGSAISSAKQGKSGSIYNLVTN